MAGLPKVSRVEAAVCAALFLAILCSAWLPRMRWGLWIDECGTFWMTLGGLQDVYRRALEWPVQSILYSALVSGFTFPGTTGFEAWMRVPSLILGIAAAGVIFLLARRWYGTAGAMVAAIVFASLPAAADLCTQARSYAPGLFFSALSLWLLDRWLEKSDWTSCAAYSLALSLLVHTHFLFIPQLIVHVHLFLWVAMQRPRGLWKQAMLPAGWLTVSILPLLPQLDRLIRQSATFVVSQKPGFMSLIEKIAWGSRWANLVLAAWIIAAVVVWWRKGRDRASAFPGAVALLYWLAVPAAFYFISITTPNRILLPRYISFSMIGFALLAGWAASLLPGWMRYSGLALFLVLSLPVFRSSWEENSPFDCRQALQSIRIRDPRGTSPLIHLSTFVEADRLRFPIDDEDLAGRYYFSPTTAYPVSNQQFFLPSKVNENSRIRWEEMRRTRLAKTDRVFIFGVPMGMLKTIVSDLKSSGWEATVLNPGQAIRAVEIRRRGIVPAPATTGYN